MSVENMPDDRLVLFYESVREQVDADRACKQRFMGRTKPGREKTSKVGGPGAPPCPRGRLAGKPLLPQ
jgi:hypothetical protein